MRIASEEEIKSVVEELSSTTHNPIIPDSEYVLELLALTMFADKQVLAAEIQAFTDIVIRFQRENVLSTDLSEGDIIKWYETHKDALSSVVQHDVFESWIEERLEKLRDFPDKHLLLRAIDEIAQSDGEKHVSEKALEVIAAKKWAESLLKLYTRKTAF